MRTTKNNYDGAPVDLDTALSMTGSGKFFIHLGLIVGGTLASAMIDNLGISFVLPAMGCELELSTAKKGLFSGIPFIGMVLTTCGFGFISDTFGRRKLLILSLGAFWLSSFSASLTPVFWLMVVLRFLAGTAASGTLSTIYAYTAEFLPPKNRTNHLFYSCISVGVGNCILPVTAWLILPLEWSLDLGFVVLRSWRILCLLNGSYMLVVFLGMLGLPESPKYLLSIDKHQEALDVLREVFSRNTGRPPSEYPVREIKKTIEDERTTKVLENGDFSFSTIFGRMKDQLALIFGRKHIFTTILGCMLQFCIIWSTRGLHLWLPDIQNRMMIYNNANPNATVTICGAMNVQSNTTFDIICQSEIEEGVYVTFLILGVNYCIGFLLLGFLSKFIAKRTLLAALQLIGGLMSLGLLWASSQISYTIFMTLSMSATGLSLVFINSLLSDLYPTHLRSTALCIVLTVGRIGGGISGIVTGTLFAHGCVPTIFGLGGMLIVVGFLTLYIPKRDDDETAVA